MPTVKQMVAAMHRLRNEIEDGVIDDATGDLERIFFAAEKSLAVVQDRFGEFKTTAGGKIAKTPGNVDAATRIMVDVEADIQRTVVRPGKDWANEIVPVMHAAGRQMARTNFTVDQVSTVQLRSIFEAVRPDERAVLKVGYERLYRIMGIAGDDTAQWMYDTMLDSVLDGIPVSGPAGTDTLQNRLIQSGRIKPIKIRGRNGRIYTRTLKARAQSIARFESARIVNRTHETLAERAIPGTTYYINSNPQDSRTTDICERASRSEPKTMAQWAASQYGVPPRANPYHL